MSAKAILKKYWGYDAFRPLQEDIIDAVLKGHDTLALLPTGGGKSICFQVPALLKQGICIVISPLIALMKDQVEQLKKRGIPAIAIYSGMSQREIDFNLDNCVYGNIKFLYVSPERLQTEMLIERVKRMQVALLAIDEAHCISQWGYDFRPPYLKIAEFRQLIPDINVVALTATATVAVRQDIQDKLDFQNGRIFHKSFARANLSYSTFYEEDKEKKLLQMLQNVPGTAIVYVRSRKRTQVIAKKLKGKGISADFYHAGLSNEEREERQDAWIQNRTRVIVATNAFGMGIDKPDVRLVVHLDLPDNLEAYYQEAGRAGRDEKKAYAVVLYDQNDIENLKKRVEISHPSLALIKKVYQSLANYLRIAVGSSMMTSYNFDIDDFISSFELDTIQTYYALKRLEAEGLLQLNEDFYNPSKVHIRLHHTELYKFQIANAVLEPIVKALLRQYGGEIFSNYVQISESKLATLLHTSLNDIIRKLKRLHEMEVIYYEQKKDVPQLVFITPRYDASKLPIQEKQLLQKKEHYSRKVEAVVHYVRHDNRCRTQLLLSYFGETDYDSCGICDNCLKKKKSRQGMTGYIDKYEEIRQLMISFLEQSPAFPDKIIRQLQPKDEKQMIEVISTMLDSGELRYDDAGRLTINS